MATAGRTTTNTLVPPTHFGSVPGVEVGTTWRYRIQVSEAGIHRPHVAGIAGRQQVGAFSIVLGGGYEDDEDNGNEVSLYILFKTEKYTLQLLFVNKKNVFCNDYFSNC